MVYRWAYWSKSNEPPISADSFKLNACFKLPLKLLLVFTVKAVKIHINRSKELDKKLL
jgi:hypothetical protein